eukprot:TRINITY_DN8216_c0_g1_i11.p2 TRINITY_DN8216_c0_g1~~TRINITY_DN8216_c0_g1_i11.p2  ORF type:complete len:120 (-),score=12.30 TRINITY_DN8216_c0_g1_i11:201-560(-)
MGRISIKMSSNETAEKLSRVYGNLIGRLIHLLCKKISHVCQANPSFIYSHTDLDTDWNVEVKSLLAKMTNIENSGHSPQLSGIHTYCSDPVQSLLSEIAKVFAKIIVSVERGHEGRRRI